MLTAMSEPSTPAGWYPSAGGQRFWDGEQWTDQFAPTPPQAVVAVREPFTTNHVLHLLVTIVTCGLWAPVWLFIAWRNTENREKYRRRLAGQGD